MELRLIAITTLLWAGMILGISFLESWVKFRTPSMTKPVGLDVGRTVFSMFYKIQHCIFTSIVLLSLIAQISIIDWILLSSVGLILSLQFFWLLPKLNSRVDIIIAGEQPASSILHALYGMTEILKLALLMLFSWVLLSTVCIRPNTPTIAIGLNHLS